MSIKHLLSYIARGTSSEALQKLLEINPSNLKTKRLMFQDIIWPRLCHAATCSSLWWMQDVTPPHCTIAALENLNEKFRG